MITRWINRCGVNICLRRVQSARIGVKILEFLNDNVLPFILKITNIFSSLCVLINDINKTT